MCQKELIVQRKYGKQKRMNPCFSLLIMIALLILASKHKTIKQNITVKTERDRVNGSLCTTWIYW